MVCSVIVGLPPQVGANTLWLLNEWTSREFVIVIVNPPLNSLDIHGLGPVSNSMKHYYIK